jgi:hypothetical protein
VIKTINVTANDIAHGKKRDCQKCPVARAVFRVARNAGWWGVSAGVWVVAFYASEAEFDGSGLFRDSAGFPESVGDWINAFDDGSPVAPFSFKLDIPELAAVSA